MKLKKLDAIGKPYRIFAELLESQAIDQFVGAMEQSCVVQGALMPDAHSGYTLPIGAVIATKGKVFPSFVGYDIGCGMVAIKTTFTEENVRGKAKEIFDGIYRTIPVGFSHNAKASRWLEGESLPRSDALKAIISEKGMSDLHSLGGGNHFQEVGVDENGSIWIVIHSGSRNLGHSTAKHYMKLAAGDGKAREGFFSLDESSKDGQDYITDLAFCLQYALENRRGMIERVERVLQTTVGDGQVLWDTLVNRNHNHAERVGDVWIHRKGATHAEAGMKGVVPGNMRDGSFIVVGKGNPESMSSSSHGAGRVMGRAEAKRKLDMETFRAEMAERGIQARIEDATLDESASAYKSIFEVMALQKDLVDVEHHIRPIINIKG